jgi:hypothetical protein
MKSFIKKIVKSLVPPKRSRGVTFAKRVVVCEVLVPISPGEVMDRWYGIQDYKKFQAMNQAFLRHMNKMESCEAGDRQRKESTPRLAIQQPKNRKMSTSNHRRISLIVVFQKQEIQWIQNVDDPQSIAKAYSHFCQSSKDAALLNARRDEVLVQKMILSPA